MKWVAPTVERFDESWFASRVNLTLDQDQSYFVPIPHRRPNRRSISDSFSST
ncbi:MAG: hypothetical protein K0S56_2781 [Microvirga sp.]|nr:hypothetical protein [Microvirga sp.]